MSFRNCFTFVRFDLLESRIHFARPDPSLAENVYFRLPLATDTTTHFYFDRDTTADAHAWDGSTHTYDGHSGSDFSGGPRGKAIFAAADGILVGRDDGYGDGGGTANGNYIRINHGNDRDGLPIMTWYLHMTAGTPTAKAIGSFIAAGEQIGGVGTSGNSTGLHLHFHASLGGVAFDPFAATGTAERSWWVNQGNGSPTTVAEAVKLKPGDTAQVYDTTSLNVRGPNPTDSSIGTRASGATGTVLAGPIYAAFNNDLINNLWVWYQVKWSDGLVGWSAQNWLQKLADTAAPTVQSTAFGFDALPHHLEVQFSENVGASLTAFDFAVTNLSTNQPVPFSMAYNATTNKATLTFNGGLPDAKYRLSIPAGAVSDAAGNPLPAYSSDFFALAGDANRDSTVNFSDLLIVAQHYGQAATFSQGDFNYDGVTNFVDLLILAQKYGTSLPVGGSTTATSLASHREETNQAEYAKVSKDILT